MKKKMLLITDVDFWNKGAGHRARIAALVNYFSFELDLTVAFVGPVVKHTQQLITNSFSLEFFVLNFKNHMSSGGYGRRLAKFLTGRKFDIVIIEYIHNSFFLNYLYQDTTVILDAHDIISERTQQFKKYGFEQMSFELSEKQEQYILGFYDYVMVLCLPDQKKVRNWIGNNKVLLCPHPVIAKHKTIKSKAHKIVFVASEYLPNQDAIDFFINQCWEDICLKATVELHIYGNVCAAVDRYRFVNIILHGFVDDISCAYQDADIVINPVRFGAGLKIKNIEAMATGTPLLTTSHGAKGLENCIGNSFLIADNPKDIVSTLIELIEDEDLRKRLSTNSCHYVTANFSAEKCFMPMANLINSLPIENGGKREFETI